MSDYLSPAERTQLEELRHADSFVDQALRQFYRILASQKFARVQQKAKDFLGFIVAKQLLGLSEQIKETTIAVSVYGEPADFNPAESSKIRVAAGELRHRLAEYSAGEGRHDPIDITMPLDTYVPDIRDHRAFIAVCRFDNWHPQGDQDHLCASISDEITYRLNQVAWVQARRPDDVRTAEDWAYRLRGSLESGAARLRLNISLACLSSGEIIYSQSVEGRRSALMSLTRKVVDLLLPVLEKDIRTNYTAGATARKPQPELA